MGNDDSPGEVVLANSVLRPLDGVLTFNLDPVAVRKIEKDKRLLNGLICSALFVLPTGQMKVKFERLQMEGQVTYLKATINDFRKRVGSMVNPATNQSPDVIIPLGNSGNAEIKNQLSSMLRQSLQVTVSTRKNSADLPLMPFLEKAIDSMLESSKVDSQNDQQRASFLLENQVTITSTLGEIKKLSKLDEKDRSDVLKKASDHYYASRKDQKSNYTGGLNVGYLGNSVGVTGGAGNSKLEENDSRIKEEKDQQKQAFDKLLQEFDGKVPTLSGIKIDDTILDSSTKQFQAKFQQNTFFVDYTLQRFSKISLIGANDRSMSFIDVIRQYAILKSDYDALQKVVGTPVKLAEAKENMKRLENIAEELKQKSITLDAALATFEKNAKDLLARVDKGNIKRLENLAEELKQKSATLDSTLSTFDKNAKDLLAKVDQDSVIKLQKEVRKLKASAFPTFSNLDSAFTNLDKDEPPPGLDCLSRDVEVNTILTAQKAWAKFLDQKSCLDSVSIAEDGKVKLEMVLVPAGKFKVGSPASEKGRYSTETQHEVTLTKPFYMGKYEVTQEQYEAVMGNNPSKNKGAKLPVTDVSWNDCREFIKKLNASTKGGFRLPYEAEWEFACRAGTTTAYSFGDNLTKSDANIDSLSISAVGSYKPNAFGLYDMHGNVWEWCEDWNENYSGGVLTDPKGPRTGISRVLRGGSFVNYVSDARSSNRNYLTPANRFNIVGFRLARTP
ncbi:MAG: SUMF1/EgtB/PvdO family nonheme iron enzyme [Planctomycetota bacterium]|nr:SUMF1/EgtB/PvdO family nonheme iron enzyme [Planctomycetota bacterium]